VQKEYAHDAVKDQGFINLCLESLAAMSLDGIDPDDSETVVAQLNEIAEQWSPDDGFPDGIDQAEVEDIVEQLRDLVSERIEQREQKTALSQREAQCNVLEHTRDEHGEWVSRKSIAIYVTLMSDRDDWLTPQAVGSYLARAEDKIERARALVREVEFPEREEHLDEPDICYLDVETRRRLKRRAKPDEYTDDAVINRLLDTTRNEKSIEEFLDEYFSARDPDTVAQLAVDTEHLRAGELRIIAHTPTREPTPECVTETDRIQVEDRSFRFDYEQTPYGPQSLSRISLYASDTIEGTVDGATVEDGLAELRMAVGGTPVREFVEDVIEDYDAKAIVADRLDDRLSVKVVVDEMPQGHPFESILQLTEIGSANESCAVSVSATPDERDHDLVLYRDGERSDQEHVAFSDGVAQLVDAVAGENQ
jgi:hypothetical protein